jgi:hypothetical protein
VALERYFQVDQKKVLEIAKTYLIMHIKNLKAQKNLHGVITSLNMP